jgi:hypothetical protein
MMDRDPAEARDFHHPYTPYDIQTDFMNAVYDCIEDGKIGIFESPTGVSFLKMIVQSADLDFRNRQSNTYLMSLSS